MTKLCECGCGGLAPIAKQAGDGYRKGEPKKFIRGHNADGKYFPRLTGKDNGNWRGGRPGADGYNLILQPDHPKADKKGYVPEHVLVCEKALGKYLPEGAVPHHRNGIKTDNRPENLIVCQDQAYHMTVHRRTRAFKSCGHAGWRKCQYCKQYDDPKNLHTACEKSYHTECRKDYSRESRIKKMLAPTSSVSFDR